MKKFNHLYENIELDWPSDVVDWQIKDSVVEPPYIELIDEEIIEIHEQNDLESDGRPSTNPGIINATNVSFLL